MPGAALRDLSRRPPSAGLRAFAGAMALLFAIAAAVQWNDPDPLRWMALYGAAALLAAGVATAREWPWLEVGVTLAFAAVVVWLGPAAAGARSEAFRSWHMQSTGDEQARELLGASIGLVFGAALVWRRARLRGAAPLRAASVALALVLAAAAGVVLRLPDGPPRRAAAAPEAAAGAAASADSSGAAGASPPAAAALAVPPDGGLSGPRVAQRYCQSCHRLPAAWQLPKESWPFVLDWMGNYLGYRKLDERFAHITDETRIPPQPLVSPAEMNRLGRWLIDAAPWAHEMRIERENPPLVGGADDAPTGGGLRFAARRIEGAAPRVGIVSLVHVDEQRGWLYVGTAVERRLRIFDRSGAKRIEIGLEADPVHVESRPYGFRLTTIGDFVQDRRRSQVLDFSFEPGGVRMRTLVQGFFRSPMSRTADVDGDGREDLVLVGFGDGFGPGRGRVCILWATPGFDAAWRDAPETLGDRLLPGAFEEQRLLDRAGAVGAQVVDFDGDGLRDVVVLTAQGTNQLLLYRNLGARRFERRVLLEEHVSIGYNAFEVLDFDGDGHLDVLLTNGNNMEMRDPPLRDYHGLRILTGDGAQGLREAYRYPMHGAMTALARDLDGDGDLDIAVNAFYPDWTRRDPETFTLLENRGGWHFEARSLGGPRWARWLRIAAGDADGDGLVDLVLGAGNLSGGGLHPGRPRLFERYRRRSERAPMVLVLEQRTGGKEADATHAQPGDARASRAGR